MRFLKGQIPFQTLMLVNPVKGKTEDRSTFGMSAGAVGCHYFPLGRELPSQLHSITAVWPVK